MRLSNQDDLRVAEEAALWVVRLKRDESPVAREEFDQWCRSPRHMREYLRARATDRRLDVLGRMPLEARRNAKTSNILIFRPRNPARAPKPLSLFTRVCNWLRARTGRKG